MVTHNTRSLRGEAIDRLVPVLLARPQHGRREGRIVDRVREALGLEAEAAVLVVDGAVLVRDEAQVPLCSLTASHDEFRCTANRIIAVRVAAGDCCLVVFVVYFPTDDKKHQEQYKYRVTEMNYFIRIDF